MGTLTAHARRLAEWGRGLPPIAVDALLALACYLTVIAYGIVDDYLTWWVVLLAAANAFPLLWRRRYPLLVTAACGVTTTWMAVENVLGEIPASQLVATYTFASLSPLWERLVCLLGTAIGLTLSIVIPGGATLTIAPVALQFLAVYALGTSARARRDRIELLEERARRLAEEQDAVAARERARIAREMHDVLAHSMSLVVVQAEAGPVAVRTDPDKAEETFETISATARDALAQLRRTLGVLRADEAERHPQPGLDTLPTLLASVEKSGLAVTLEEHGVRRAMPADLALTAYRIVQESLTNTVKHAHASHAHVRLDWRDGGLELAVSDNGRGPGDDKASAGRGLVGMRQRVAAVGGQLASGAGPGGVGFQITARLPLDVGRA